MSEIFWVFKGSMRAATPTRCRSGRKEREEEMTTNVRRDAKVIK